MPSPAAIDWLAVAGAYLSKNSIAKLKLCFANP
jgi:hypothetical protein